MQKDNKKESSKNSMKRKIFQKEFGNKEKGEEG